MKFSNSATQKPQFWYSVQFSQQIQLGTSEGEKVKSEARIGVSLLWREGEVFHSEMTIHLSVKIQKLFYLDLTSPKNSKMDLLWNTLVTWWSSSGDPRLRSFQLLIFVMPGNHFQITLSVTAWISLLSDERRLNPDRVRGAILRSCGLCPAPFDLSACFSTWIFGPNASNYNNG